MMDGSSIECHFHNGEICGPGVRRFPNGALYQGHFQMGERHGPGVLYGANNIEKFDGHWESNRLHGEAKCQLRNQDRILRGMYKAHFLHGDAIEYLFMNGVARYFGQCANGKFHGQGRFEARRFFGEPPSNHETLPAGTTLPANSILNRTFGKNGDLQPVWESYQGQWERAKKHGAGKWRLTFATKTQANEMRDQLSRGFTTADDNVDESSQNDEFLKTLHLLEFNGDWNEDRPTFPVTNLLAVDLSQPSNWRTINNPFLAADEQQQEELPDLQRHSDSHKPRDEKVVALDEPALPVSIPQMTIKQSAPLNLRVFLTRRRKQPPPKDTGEPEVRAPTPSKGKKTTSKPTPVSNDDTPPQDKYEFVQITGETGRLIECKLFKIPDSFVKKKPAKGEEPEEIHFTRLPSVCEECDTLAGIPASAQVKESSEGEQLGPHASITLDFAEVPVGYYAVRFRNQLMTLGMNERIEDYIVYMQVVKK